MSFLLDALGKADNDRRRATVPELRTRRPKHNSPAKRLLKGAVLLCVVLLSFVMGYVSRPYIETGVTVSIGRDHANISAQQANTAADPVAKAVNDSGQAQLQVPLPPSIELSVISYSSVPTERFVMLNGFLMYEGDILAEGERLLEIKPDGIVLEKDGRQYNLGLAISSRR